MSHDPILREAELPRFSITAKRPVPKANTQIVYVDARNEPYLPRQPLTRGEAAFRNLRRLYEVDTSEHAAEVTYRVPCRQHGFYFLATVRLRWRIEDPAAIVRDGRRDITPVYEDHVVDLLRGFSHDYGYDERREAEKALQSALDATRGEVLDEGIRISRYALSLSHEQELEEHVASTLRTEIKVAQVSNEETVERRAFAAKQDRMRRYGEWVKNGDADLMLLYLDQNPENVGEIINLLESKRRENVDNVYHLFDTLVNAGLVPASTVEQIKRGVISSVAQDFGSRAVGERGVDLDEPRAIDVSSEIDDDEDD